MYLSVHVLVSSICIICKIRIHSIKDKKTADPSSHDYAVVNKSKKKKKEADENAYATVDKSKKSKKVSSGHVLYAHYY